MGPDGMEINMLKSEQKKGQPDTGEKQQEGGQKLLSREWLGKLALLFVRFADSR